MLILCEIMRVPSLVYSAALSDPSIHGYFTPFLYVKFKYSHTFIVNVCGWRFGRPWVYLFHLTGAGVAREFTGLSIQLAPYVGGVAVV